MINEVSEVSAYINGNNINKKNLYRICYLLAKWYKEQGLSHVDIRQAIFKWGSENGIHIKYNLNGIIYRALDDKSRLKDNIIVRVNKKDVDEIKSRFDSKNTRLAALGILCYAKAYADRDKRFVLSSVALASWLKIHTGNLSSRYLKELTDFGYITKIPSRKSHRWSKDSSTTMFQMQVDIHNSGEYVLVENDIHELYVELFG